jgi:hypothetical protein
VHRLPINPFNPYYPAQDALFANRGREQVLFRRALRASTASGSPGPWNIALVGPWGIGKTSLLRRFVAMARSHQPRVGVVSLSVTSSLGGFDGFAASLLRRIREEMRGQTRWPARVQDEIGRWEPAITVGPLSAARRSEPAVAGTAMLYAELRRLWSDHVRGNLAAVAFFLDDVQNLLAVQPDLLLNLRAVFQDLQGLGAVFPLTVTGPEGMFEAAGDLAEPVTRFFERLPLGAFSLDDTRQAIVEPLRAAGHHLVVDEDAVRLVWERSGGHPYFVAFIMREAVDLAVERRAAAISADLLNREWGAVARQMAVEKFSVEWNSATMAEKAVLRTVVAADTPAPPPKRSPSSLAARLVRKGLLVRRSRGDYDVYHPLFAEYVRQATD